MDVSFGSRLSVTRDVLIRDVSGESVVLDLKNERYLGLDPVGARMWTVLTGSTSIQAAYEVLLAEYEVDAGRLRRDLEDFVAKLIEHGLVEVDKAR